MSTSANEPTSRPGPLRLKEARIGYYRSIVDSKPFKVEEFKTILVGPNESGKTAILTALSSLNPAHERRFNPVREFPRRLYKAFELGELPAESTPIAAGIFELNDTVRKSLASLDPFYAKAKTVTVTRYWDWQREFAISSGYPKAPTWASVRGDVAKLAAALPQENAAATTYTEWASSLSGDLPVSDANLRQKVVPWLDEIESDVGARYKKMLGRVRQAFEWKDSSSAAISILDKALPKFVYYDNYWRAHARIHLQALKERIATGQTEDYDFADTCLLKYIGLAIDEMIALGQVEGKGTLEKEKSLDTRFIKLNASGIELTKAITKAWGDEVYHLRFDVDSDYLRVVAVDAEGVELEVSEKSLGYQWFFSFFTVFYAEARDNLAGAFLLLDEPGLHLHGLKQARLRETLDGLSAKNQLIHTTHSPFLVGPDELLIARVVEVPEGQASGTIVHDTTIAPSNPASFFPLQHALGYVMAQSMFGQKKNLCVEGAEDLWYLQSLRALHEASNEAILPPDLAIVAAGGAQRVVTYATILFAQEYSVAALFDSDKEGKAAATLDTLVKLLEKRSILLVGNFLGAPASGATIEDLLGVTLLGIAESDLGVRIPEKIRLQQKGRRVLGLFEAVAATGQGFKARLAKAFSKWAQTHEWEDLDPREQKRVAALFEAVAKALA